MTLTSITRLFALYGQPITLTTAGAARTLTCLIVPMDASTINTYFDGNESVGLLRPAFTLFASGAELSPPLQNDLFTYADLDDLSRGPYTVRRVQAFRISNVIVVYMALCD